ncbi:hypothetical protein CUMW_110020 [Citrus unshiu]|nr:hypothetical protein CUMW_110020 [Citrus unshiu]
MCCIMLIRGPPGTHKMPHAYVPKSCTVLINDHFTLKHQLKRMIQDQRFSSVEHKRLFYTKSLRLPNRLFRSGRLPVSGSGRPVRP